MQDWCPTHQAREAVYRAGGPHNKAYQAREAVCRTGVTHNKVHQARKAVCRTGTPHTKLHQPRTGAPHKVHQAREAVCGLVPHKSPFTKPSLDLRCSPYSQLVTRISSYS